MVTVDTLLAELPEYRDEWVSVKENQKVPDIIKQILRAHDQYAEYYDKIALYFDADTIEGICNKIYRFCKSNITYQEEPDTDQTTALPTGILTRGYGDCKHYASFIGGILDALRRTGRKINWCYRFASYKTLQQTPYHVFIVVMDGDDEIWIDPTPEANAMTPIWIQDKKINASTMALRNNIGYVGDYELIGTASLTVTPVVDIDNLNFDGSGKYAGVFNPFLGLSAYRDYGGDRNINENAVADQINALIASGPEPGHTVNGQFIKWIYDNNVRSWNFYYAGGVEPGFTADSILPASYPRPIITADGRLTLDHDALLDDANNGEIHLLTAWLQAIINEEDDVPYPIKPTNIKLFSQTFTGNPGNTKANFFNEWRGKGIIEEVAKALNKYVNVIKENVFKIVGSIPRNAFLSIVRNNGHNFANDLYEKIQEGKWDDIAGKWKGLGGNPEKLRSAIEEGRTKESVGDAAETAPNDKADFLSKLPGLLGAAAAIIKILIGFFTKNKKAQDIAALVPFNANSQIIIDPKDNENLGGGNNDLPGNDILSWVKENPLPVAGIVSIGTYFILNNKKKKEKNFLIPLIAGAAAYFSITMLLNKGTSSSTLTIPQKRDLLLKWDKSSATDSQESIDRVYKIIQTMPDDEIIATYSFIFDYVANNVPVPTGSALYSKIMAISAKYDIFT